MSFVRNVLFVVFILFLISKYTDSLVCYSCEGCGDPFDPTGVQQITLNDTNLYCKKTRGASIIDRNITNICDPFTAVGNGVQCCQTDLCNGSHPILSNSSLIFIFLIGIICKFI